MPSVPTGSDSLTRGRYELGELLGAGGMGTIHRAQDRLAERQVAYKRLVVSNEADRPRLTALFQREYDTLARLDHPNIVAAYDYGFDQQGPYYAMELLPGDDLSKLSPISWRACCRLLRDIASALSLVHARALIHRDVSPNNVRISHAGEAKLLDFGALTGFGTPTEVVGTPAFIAPECLSNEPLDQRTDLYALGALGYWALTRRLAVHAYSLEELPDAWEVPIAPPSRYVPDIPRGLDDLILSLLQVDKRARPRSAADVIERLTTIADLEPEQLEQRVALSYLEHTPLCGRAAVMQSLRGFLSNLVESRGAVLSIEGAHGMGRTAVLEQLAVDSQLRGACVLRAEGKVHTGPLALMTHLVQSGLARYPDLLQRSAELRQSIAPTLSPKSMLRSPMEVANHQVVLADSMQAALLEIARRGPLVILIDDTECADEQSLGLLASMSEAIAQRAILLATTRLPGPAPNDSLASLYESGCSVSLAALSQNEVVQLARSIFGDVPNMHGIAQWLYDESAGEPAACVELVRTLLAQGDVRYARGTFMVPSELKSGLAQKTSLRSALRTLAGLDAGAEQLAQLLSLSESALTIEQLSTASGRPSAETFASLDQLLVRKLLLTSGGKYAFASFAVRAGIAEWIQPEPARKLHLALARTLSGEPEATLAMRYAAGLHCIRAGGDHELEGAALIAQAARDRSYEVALAGISVRYLEAALEVYRRHGVPDRELLDLLVPLSVAGFYGDMGAQRRHLDATMGALNLLSGFALASRLSRVLKPRLALILGIVCTMVWRLLRPTRLHRRSVPQNIESALNVVSTATASAASILDEAEAGRIAGWLEPVASASAKSGMQIARQFCMAVSELPAGKLQTASGRLEQVMSALEKPIRGMDDRVREQMRCGCLNGLAQANIEERPKFALDAAERLARSGAFFAPHAELTRALYHGLRGELGHYERHRARTEALALRGGFSWSAMTLLTLRDHQIARLTGNTNTLVRVAAELQRMAALGPSIQLQSGLAHADLLLVRGRAPEAVERYSLLLDDRSSSDTFSLLANAMYARALRESGSPERAIALCERAIQSSERSPESRVTHGYRLLLRELALAEAECGLFERSLAGLEQQLALATTSGDENPLLLGSIHRDRARVAIEREDVDRFEMSYAEMKRWFKRTENPWLLQQCGALLTCAIDAGVRPAISLSLPSATVSDDLDGSTVVGDGRLSSPPQQTDIRTTSRDTADPPKKRAL
jgi:tetratricopeptide (TPR) repeat protein